jgi:hypothetical protein
MHNNELIEKIETNTVSSQKFNQNVSQFYKLMLNIQIELDELFVLNERISNQIDNLDKMLQKKSVKAKKLINLKSAYSFERNQLLNELNEILNQCSINISIKKKNFINLLRETKKFENNIDLYSNFTELETSIKSLKLELKIEMIKIQMFNFKKLDDFLEELQNRKETFKVNLTYMKVNLSSLILEQENFSEN